MTRPLSGSNRPIRRKRRVLCVDDDKDTLELLRVFFESDGFYVKTANTALGATYLLQNSLFDLYLLDNRLPDMHGLDLIKKIRTFDVSTPIVLSSGDAREEEQKRALMCGAQAYVTKPWDPDVLLATVNNLIDLSELRAIDAQSAETDAILQQIADHRETLEPSFRKAQRVRVAAREAFLAAGGTYAAFQRDFPRILSVTANHKKKG